MAQKTINTVSEESIPEVLRFLEANDRVQSFYEKHSEIFSQLLELRGEYNAALEAAEKVVRAKRVSCGPFVAYQIQTKYDAEKLYEEVGRDRFLELGGKIQTVTTFDLDKAKFEAHVVSNNVSQEVVDTVKEVSPRYKKPEKITL